MRWRAFLLAALLRLAATALVYTAGVDRAPWRVQPQLDADHIRSCAALLTHAAPAQLFANGGDAPCHAPPLAVIAMEALQDAGPWVLRAVTLVLELALAGTLASLAAQCAPASHTGAYVALVIGLNPFLAAAATGGGASTVLYLALALFVLCIRSERAAEAGVWLAVGAYLSPHYIVLGLVGPCLARGRWRFAAAALTATAALHWTSWYLFGPSYLASVYGALWHLQSLRPNLGMWWYLFELVFPEFRLVFLRLCHLGIFMAALPLAARLRHAPNALAPLLLALVATLHPLACAADSGLAVAMALLPHPLQHEKAHTGLALGLLAMCAVLGPGLWQSWTQQGTTNPNFFFALTLAIVAAKAALVGDMAWVERLAAAQAKHGPGTYALIKR